MSSLPNRRTRVKSIPSLPLFDWAHRQSSRNHHIPPMARHLQQCWGYSPAAARAVCEAWGFDGGQDYE